MSKGGESLSSFRVDFRRVTRRDPCFIAIDDAKATMDDLKGTLDAYFNGHR